MSWQESRGATAQVARDAHSDDAKARGDETSRGARARPRLLVPLALGALLLLGGGAAAGLALTGGSTDDPGSSASSPGPGSDPDADADADEGGDPGGTSGGEDLRALAAFKCVSGGTALQGQDGCIRHFTGSDEYDCPDSVCTFALVAFGGPPKPEAFYAERAGAGRYTVFTIDLTEPTTRWSGTIPAPVAGCKSTRGSFTGTKTDTGYVGRLVVDDAVSYQTQSGGEECRYGGRNTYEFTVFPAP